MTNTKQKLTLLERAVVLGAGVVTPIAFFNFVNHNYEKYLLGKAWANDYLHASIAGTNLEVGPVAFSTAIGIGVAYLVKKGIDKDHDSRLEVD